METGWATAQCSGPVKASALFRHNGTRTAGGGVRAGDGCTSHAVRHLRGSEYRRCVCQPFIRFRAGHVHGTQSSRRRDRDPEHHRPPPGGTIQRISGPLFSLASFQGSVTITASAPIVSLSLNAEASPIMSSLPPGQPDGSPAAGAQVYYFAHIAAASNWRTTFTYVNASAAPVTCDTSFYSDTGAPLPLSFNGSQISSTSDAIPREASRAVKPIFKQPSYDHRLGDRQVHRTSETSTLFRDYSGNVPEGEASVIAATSPASQFVTYADQTTGVAYANPSASSALVSFTARNAGGEVVGSGSVTLAPGAHGQSNLGQLLGNSSFQGSVTITSGEPIVSLSLNAEAYPSFSSFPPGDAASFQVYGAWDCGNDSCNWRTVRNMTQFDTVNHWMIDRGDGTGLPSVNLVVLSFVQPTKLLNLTSDSATVNGIPIGMNPAVVDYFTSHNVRVTLSVGGATT